MVYGPAGSLPKPGGVQGCEFLAAQLRVGLSHPMGGRVSSRGSRRGMLAISCAAGSRFLPTLTLAPRTHVPLSIVAGRRSVVQYDVLARTVRHRL